MDVIERVRDGLQAFYDRLSSGIAIGEIIQDNEKIILRMNADEQLYEEGINTRGVSIASYAPYTPFTVQIKQMKGQPTDRVTLRDEGDFERSFYLQVDSDIFTIRASDWKTEELVQKYGDEILGLTDDNIDIVRTFVVRELKEQLQKYLNGQNSN